MKITGVQSYIVNKGVKKNLIFVRVHTDEGLHGWGEAYSQSDRDTSVTAHVRQLARYLEGRNPFAIKHFTHVAYEDFASKRGGMDFWCAVSGIEQALWDIVGKALDTPVYNLLGGPCRDKIRVYANGWSEKTTTPEEFAENARSMVARGFTALKFDPFPGPWRLYVSREAERHAIEVISAVRQAVGPSIELMIEVHRRLAPMHAIRVAHEIERFDPVWFEEPCPADNLDALAEVRSRINIPVVTGETLYTKADFREVFEKRAADIINPDVCNTGGILEMKEIAAMAEPHYVGVSPHNYNSVAIGLASTVQVSACIPNLVITEYWVNMEPLSHEIAVDPFVVEGGYIRLPEKPGLGMDLDEAALAALQTDQIAPRHIRRPHEEVPYRPDTGDQQG